MGRLLGKLLIVEDNRINCDLLANILKDEYDILTAENGKEAFQLLSEYGKEIVAIVLDLKMPVMDGYEFMEKFADVQEYRHIPIIIQTSNGEEETEKRCLDIGAWDFITKPIQPGIVKIRIRHAVERAKVAALEIDSLTGLYRKDKFYRATKQMIERNKQVDFVFVCFDIDRFKMINTFYGNAEGDGFLKYVSNVLMNLAEGNRHCTFGHIQADQFCMCMEYDKDKMDDTVEFIDKEVSNFNKSFYIKPSIGIYIISNGSEDISAMYDKAELAAKTCKNNSLRFFAYYTEDLSEQLLKEQTIVNEMNDALKQGQFQIYLQPKYDVHTEQPAGAEALVRWMHPVKGIISPNEFIPIFE